MIMLKQMINTCLIIKKQKKVNTFNIPILLIDADRSYHSKFLETDLTLDIILL